MTRNVIGDFRGVEVVLFFFPWIWLICRDWGGGVYQPFLSLLPTALETIHRPLALIVSLRHFQLFFREIGRAPLFCRLLLPLSDIPQICQDSNPQRATQQKSKRLSFQFIFRWAKLDARFSPYPIFKPFNPKKKRKNLSAHFPGRPFFPLSFIQFPVLYLPYILALCIFLCGLSIQGRRIGDGKNFVWQNDNRHQEITGKMVEISFPSPLVGGGIPLLLPHRNFLPLGPFWLDGLLLWREIDMGARAGVWRSIY